MSEIEKNVSKVGQIGVPLKETLHIFSGAIYQRDICSLYTLNHELTVLRKKLGETNFKGTSSLTTYTMFLILKRRPKPIVSTKGHLLL